MLVMANSFADADRVTHIAFALWFPLSISEKELKLITIIVIALVINALFN